MSAYTTKLSSVLSCVLFFSCLSAVSAQDSETPQARTWGKQAGAFQLSIATDQDRYVLGEPVRISVVLKNVTDDEAWFVNTQREVLYDMRVWLPSPDWIPLKQLAALTPEGDALKHPHMGNYAGAKVPAGREMPEELWISKLYYMTIPGTYHVVISCRQPLHERYNPQVTITSNEIAVTVLAKQP